MKRAKASKRSGKQTVIRSISIPPELARAVDARVEKLSGDKPPRYGFSQFTVKAIRNYLQELNITPAK